MAYHEDVVSSTLKVGVASGDVAMTTSFLLNKTWMSPRIGGVESVIKCVAGSVMTIVTVLGQVMVFVVVSRDPRLRTPNNYFIVSLALADFLIGVISMPMWTIYSALDYWPFDQVWCDIWNVLDVVLCRVSIYTIFFLALDRFLTLRDPLGYPLRRTPRRTKIILVSIWVVCGAIFSPFIEAGQLVYGQHRNLEQCNVFYTRSVPMTFVMAALSLWSTLVSIAVIYVLIYCIAQRAGHINDKFDKSKMAEKDPNQDDYRYGSRSQVYAVSATISEVKLNEDKGQGRVKGKQDKAMKTITVLLVSLMVCWLPLSVAIVLRVMRPDAIGVAWMVVTYWMVYINSMLNPLCYAIGNPHFRETLLGLFTGRRPVIGSSSSFHSTSSLNTKKM